MRVGNFMQKERALSGTGTIRQYLWLNQKPAKLSLPLRKASCFRFELQRLPGGADEFAKNGDVGAVNADAPSIDWETETFGKIEIDAGIVQFRKAVALRGRNSI